MKSFEDFLQLVMALRCARLVTDQEYDDLLCLCDKIQEKFKEDPMAEKSLNQWCKIIEEQDY